MYWTGGRGAGLERYIDRRVLAGGGREAKVCVRIVLLEKHEYHSRAWWGRGEDTVLVFVKDIERFYTAHCEIRCRCTGWSM